MYNKIYNIFDKLLSLKVLVITITIFTIINLSILCIITTLHNKWGNFFAILYPEEVYQELEEEANRMIQNGAFESVKFQLDTIDYNRKTGKLILSLSEGTHSVNITINNYRMENQEATIKRDRQPDKEDKSLDVLILLLISIFFSSTVMMFIIALLAIVWFAAFFLHKILD